MFEFLKKKKKPVFMTAVIAAGGSSARMGGENKLLAELKKDFPEDVQARYCCRSSKG